MSNVFLSFHNVTFGYENSLTDILTNVSFQLGTGWTGIIGANGCGKTTLLKLACGQLKFNSGNIESPARKYYNEQRTDDAPLIFPELIRSFDNYAIQLIEKLQIKQDWFDRWTTLSHGERKRVQIACALWNNPDLLAIDEPTNHLDSIAKEMIYASLKFYKGVGLIVSHDRDLMENLCTQFLFIDPPVIDYRRGKLSEATAQRKTENDTALKQLDLKKQEIGKLQQEYKRRSDIVELAKKKSSKRNIAKHDTDAKAKIDFGRLTNKDAVGGRLKTVMSGRIDNAKEELEQIEVKRSYKTGIMLSSSYSKRNYLLNLEPGEIQLSKDKLLVYNKLVISSKDRIAITGENGSGKSTFIKYALNYINAESENITYIPQEISVEETKELINKVRKLPKDELGKLMIIISRLGSDAKRVLETEIPSPGETRKLLLGLGISQNPHIIIMDEPTNHMDLVSIECLEDALQNVSCALLLVSHDRRFLDALTNIEWKIIKKANGFDMVTG